jgi:uncharacterized protein YebE (UPF0316 family)
MRESAVLFLIQVVQYSVVCFSYRTLAQAQISLTVTVDLFYSLMQFLVIRRISQSSTKMLAAIAYALGSAVGTYIGIVVSLKVLGK